MGLAVPPRRGTRQSPLVSQFNALHASYDFVRWTDSAYDFAAAGALSIFKMVRLFHVI